MGRTVSVGLEGGEKIDKYLHMLSQRLGRGAEASIGFLEGATYPVGIERDRKAGHKIQGKNVDARQSRAAESTHSVAQVAFWQQYGTTKIPPRPYFTNMIEEQQPTWAPKLAIAIKMSGYRPKRALEILAADIKGHLVKSINLLQDPPLSQVTIDRKGFSKPLVDTAVMIRSVDWIVRAGAPTRD